MYQAVLLGGSFLYSEETHKVCVCVLLSWRRAMGIAFPSMSPHWPWVSLVQAGCPTLGVSCVNRAVIMWANSNGYITTHRPEGIRERVIMGFQKEDCYGNGPLGLPSKDTAQLGFNGTARDPTSIPPVSHWASYWLNPMSVI